MKYTLADCIETINQILNYPSVAYSDISHFFDHAISELNTELNIGLKPISELYKKSTFKLESLKDFIFLENAPTPEVKKVNSDEDFEAWKSSNSKVCFRITDSESHIAYKKNDEILTTTKLYGVYARYGVDPVTNTSNGHIARELYQTVIISGNAYWTPYEFMPDRELNLLDILPFDWITMFVIPYVCFKYAVRNGDSGTLYAEEFQQGAAQLNKSYDIPSFVNLSECAGLPAYKTDVEENLPNLNVKVPTRAIYENMKIGRNVNAIYGGMYDRGGWNL